MRYELATKQQLIQITLHEPCGTNMKYKACRELQWRLYSPIKLKEMEEYEMSWGEERIEQFIFEAMDILNLNRMPTAQELRGIDGGGALANEIYSTKKFNGWAKHLGLDTYKDRLRTREYAVYNGDEFLFIDTPRNCAKRLGISINTFKFYCSEQHERRVLPDGIHVVCVGSEGDYEHDYPEFNQRLLQKQRNRLKGIAL